MAHGPRYHVPYRRRREGKTDYRKRLTQLKSGLPRLVVRRTNTKTIVQVAEYQPDGDRILAQATSSELASYGWEASFGTLPAAYLTGLLAGMRAVKAGVEGAILDGGLLKPSRGGRVYGALKGAVDGGLEVTRSEGVLPPDERLRGEHLAETVPAMFDKVKQKIMEGSS